MDLGTLLPPPHIRGKLTAVKLEPNAVATCFGDAAALANSKPVPDATGSYMAFEGNSVRFGKLTMANADLIVLDLDPADELDWNQDHYGDQLLAGSSKMTSTFGMRAYVKDYDKLARGGATPPPGGF